MTANARGFGGLKQDLPVQTIWDVASYPEAAACSGKSGLQELPWYLLYIVLLGAPK